MLKKNTSISRNYHDIIAGEWISAENNANGTTINFLPEMIFPEESTPYRGHFQVIDNGDCTVSVCDTAAYAVDDEFTPVNAGAIFLHWQEITPPGESEIQYSILRRKMFMIPALKSLAIQKSGWLALKMTRINPEAQSKYAFSDKYLGSVAVNFTWTMVENIGVPSAKHDYMFTAYINYSAETSSIEIIQQQYGPGIMYLPQQTGTADDSDSLSFSKSQDSSSSLPPEISNSYSKSSSSSGSSSSSASSSSSDTVPKIIYVNFHFISNTTSRGVNSTMQSYTEVQLYGSFTVGENYPDNGYRVTMTGWEKYDEGFGDGVQQSEVSHSVVFFRNEDLGFWDFYDSQAFDWGNFYDDYDAANDVLSATPIYEHPDLESNPVYPQGEIVVVHEITNGTTVTPPLFFLESTLTITFSTQKETGENQ